MAFPTGSGVRNLEQAAMAILGKRMPNLPKKTVGRPLAVQAIDPLQHVLSHYPEGMRGDVLARARLFQEGEPLQYLESGPNQGRWWDKGGVTSYEMPLLTYQGKNVPGSKENFGTFWSQQLPNDPSPQAAIQVAMGTPHTADILQEEAIHALDRLLIPGQRQMSRRFDAPESFLELLGETGSPAAAEKTLRYLSIPAETRATLSGLIPKARAVGPLETQRQAEELLERARDTGNVRERATGEAILRSQKLRNENIPYLLKALGVGGAMAGTYPQE